MFTDAEQEPDGTGLGNELAGDGEGGDGGQVEIGELVITAEDYHIPLNALLLAPSLDDPRPTLPSFSALWGALVSASTNDL